MQLQERGDLCSFPDKYPNYSNKNTLPFYDVDLESHVRGHPLKPDTDHKFCRIYSGDLTKMTQNRSVCKTDAYAGKRPPHQRNACTPYQHPVMTLLHEVREITPLNGS